jgi:hypothetical protein
MSREAMKQPEALRLADALDDEFTQGRISNHNGRKAAVELRRLHEVNQTYHEKVIPKREWVGLTEKEVKAIANKRNDYGLPMTGRMWVFVADLTDKLKEKNHG